MVEGDLPSFRKSHIFIKNVLQGLSDNPLYVRKEGYDSIYILTFGTNFIFSVNATIDIIQAFNDELLDIALKFARGRKPLFSNEPIVITKEDMLLALKHLGLESTVE